MKFFYLILPLFITSLIMVYQGEEITTVRLVINGDQVIQTPLTSDSVVVVNGSLHLTPSASVTKTLYVVGGELTLSGTVENIVQLGGSVHVDEGGVVNGNVSVFSGEFISENNIATEESEQFFNRLSQNNEPYALGTQIRTSLTQLVVLLLVAFGIAQYAPSLLRRTMNGLTNSFSTNLAYGILLLLVVPSVIFVLVFTGILVPVALVLVGIGGFTLLLGYILLGATLGEMLLQRMQKKEYSLRYSTCIGVTVLHFLVAVISVIPILALLVMGPLLLASVGELFTSRFGLLTQT